MNRLQILADLKMPPDALHLLRTRTSGCELRIAPPRGDYSLASIDRKRQFAEVDIAFGQPDPMAIVESVRLKWVHISSSGITRYDNEEFRRVMVHRNIVVTNSASVYNEPCAIHALSFILAQARKLPVALTTRTAGETAIWGALRTSSTKLRGETIVIVGYGAIGKRLKELLHPFGMMIIACRRRLRGDEGVTTITLDQLHRTLQSADHVMNILPESDETKHFFDRARLGAIKPGAIFYNIGRGATVDQDALVEALHKGHLRAAWLDVTEPEPLPDCHPLWAAPNCFITPHTAGGHVDEAKSLVGHFLENLDRFMSGKPLQDRVI